MNKETELIRQAFLNSDDYIIVCDSKFEIILRNNKCNDLVKVNNVLSLFDLTGKQSLNNALKEKKQDQNYFELTSKINIDDKIVCVYIKIFPVILKSTYFIFLIKDITYEEDIKKELKIEKMFMFNIMNQLPDSIYIKDKNSNFLRINKTQIEILGVKDEFEALGKSDKDFFTEVHSEEAFEDEQNLINGIVPFIKKEEFIKHAKQDFRWVSTIKAPLIDEEKNIIGTLGITRDITDKKQIEAALQKSELLFKSIWNNSIDGMRILDPEGKIFMVNPAFCLMFGLTEEELIGKNISVLFYEKLPEIRIQKRREKTLKKVVEDIKNKNIPYRFESQIHLWSDSFKWFEITNGYIELENKTYLLSVFRDITERKNAEVELSNSENLNKTTINALSDMLFVTDKKNKVVLINNSLLNFFKNVKEDYICKDLELEDMFNVFPFLGNNFYQVISDSKKELIIFEKYNIGSSNYFFEVKFIPVIDKNQVIRIITLILDITDIKKYEEDLRRSALIFENLNDSVFMFNNRGEIIDLNAATEVMFGFNKKELINRHISVFDGYGLRIPNIFELKKAIEERKRWNAKLWYQNPIKTKNKHIDIEILPLTDTNGENLAFFAISRDITELTVATNKLNVYIGELQKKTLMLEESEKELKLINSSKDKFFSIIAHDLKSPFQSILGFYNILKEDFDNLSKEEVEYIIKNMGEGTKNLYALIENLLEWSRVQLGKIEVVKENFNLSDLTKSVISLLKGYAVKKEIEVEQNLGDNIFVFADIKMINSVINNLLSNSLKFTNRGGIIKITIAIKKKSAIFKLEDNGIGMDKVTLRDLFKIDKNISRRGTENEKGTGLGLVLCKEFIERNGGTLTVKSKVNNGSTFTFTIPITN